MNGSCLCGSIKFEINSDSLNMYQCHCEQCRKQTGTASSCGSIVPEEKFTWVYGKSKIRKWEKESGFTSHFCSDCGSSVPNKFREQPYYWIPVGLIDKGKIHTVANLFISEKPDWSNLKSETNHFQTKPNIQIMLKLLCQHKS